MGAGTGQGQLVNFTVGDEKYTGTISAAGLRRSRDLPAISIAKAQPCRPIFEI